ncbi:MAG: glucose-1-phosphate adenylyltransferase [Verrucomicrobiota bacterium]
MDNHFPDARRVISLILGGGAGTRLYPLTQERAKPAVPLAGKYRLVDIPISLCINSGLRRIFLLTQYLSSSLHRHVTQSYRFDDYYPKGFIEIMAAAQSRDGDSWYQGTADAVRQNLMHLRTHDHDTVLILSGDQLYRMDYRHILYQHYQKDADITVATIPVSREPARGFGIMHVDDEDRIQHFVEKPKEDSVLDGLQMPRATRERVGVPQEQDLFLASMGIYVFKREVLEDALKVKRHQDFGKHIIPLLISQDKRVYSYVYQGYWEDIGTIRAFYNANLDLTEIIPQFNFFDVVSPIYSRARYLPASKLHNCRVEKVVLADGCILSGADVTHSIIGVRSRLESGVVIRDSIVMGSDYFESPEVTSKNNEHGIPPLGIGEGTQIQGAIVDKNVRIGKNVSITAEGKDIDMDHPLYYVRDGIVIIPKGCIVPDGTVI